MASTEHDVPVRLSIFGMPPREGTARVRRRDAGERSARALRAGGLLLGLAILSVFLPIAHFVLVPGFLIAAPIFAIRRLRERDSIVALSGTCPRCDAPRTFEAGGAMRDHLRTTCAVCSFAIDVEAVGAQAVPAPARAEV
jgi:hypothetical protein